MHGPAKVSEVVRIIITAAEMLRARSFVHRGASVTRLPYDGEIVIVSAIFTHTPSINNSGVQFTPKVQV